jgi:hypothetical protein
VVALIESDTTLHSNDAGIVISDLDDINSDALYTLNLLVRCVNLTISEIATDYVPLTSQEIVTVTKDFLEYSALTKVVLDVLKITTKGASIKFKSEPNGMPLKNARYTVEYRYLPKRGNWEDEIDYNTGLVTARVVAYGVITEYCIISGLTDDAVMWDGRYRQALLTATTKSEKRVKPQQWLR